MLNNKALAPKGVLSMIEFSVNERKRLRT
jgi:hypothetical protein